MRRGRRVAAAAGGAYCSCALAAPLPMRACAGASQQLFTPLSLFPAQAHGKAVGLPSDDDMGNSEVGHNALGE